MRTIRIGLGALVLGVGLAVEAQVPLLTNTRLVGGIPQFDVLSPVGLTNQIQCSTDLGHTNWVVLTNLLVTQSQYSFVDVGAPPAPYRFYRVVALALETPLGMALVPAGSFIIGDTLDGEADAVPTNVTLSAFYMDTHGYESGKLYSVAGGL
jgi:hypothetical protein